MPEHSFIIQVEPRWLRSADGRLWGMHLSGGKIVDLWFVMNRDTGEAEELRRYTVGMFSRRPHA